MRWSALGRACRWERRLPRSARWASTDAGHVRLATRRAGRCPSRCSRAQVDPRTGGHRTRGRRRTSRSPAAACQTKPDVPSRQRLRGVQFCAYDSPVILSSLSGARLPLMCRVLSLSAATSPSSDPSLRAQERELLARFRQCDAARQQTVLWVAGVEARSTRRSECPPAAESRASGRPARSRE